MLGLLYHIYGVRFLSGGLSPYVVADCNLRWLSFQQPSFVRASVIRSKPGIWLPPVKGKEATTLHGVSRRDSIDTGLPFGPREHNHFR